MRLPRSTIAELAARFAGDASRVGADVAIDAIEPIATAGKHALAPLLSGRYVHDACDAIERGAVLLVAADLASRLRAIAPGDAAIWVHPAAPSALAELLDLCTDEAAPATMGQGTTLGPNVTLYPGVILGARVRIEAGAVLGSPGFGWVPRLSDGVMRAMPQRAGVLIEDDVRIGPNCTIDAGTLSPTRIRRGAKLDAQVHVGHNVDIGEGAIVAAQTGFAGSAIIGKGVLVGGQVGVGDHVRIGDGARIAGKSGVIGDVPAGGVVAGYPAVARLRWLRALATMYKRSDG